MPTRSPPIVSVAIYLIAATAFLAYSNGANDNFKGVATLFGSNTTRYRGAIAWATAATMSGAISSIFLAEKLVKRFSGKGLVPDVLTVSPEFLLAVAAGAGCTVMVATLFGFPISTTHSLTGALVGAGVSAVGIQVNFAVLGTAFFAPLLLSPLVAVVASAGLYVVLRFLRKATGVTKETVVGIGPQPTDPGDGDIVYRYAGTLVGVSAQRALDASHYVSAGVVSFARGLNDTPKIVALLVAAGAIGLQHSMLLVAIAMAAGGLLSARKVAQTMSRRITPMNPSQGFTANFVTGILVVLASRLGMPVSTTHVSVGSLFGIGTANRSADTQVVRDILYSWVLTLPVAAVLAGLCYALT